MPAGLEPTLNCVVEHAAQVLEVDQVNIRLLDPSRSRLMAICRAGEPLHEDPAVEFNVSEGLVGWIVANGKPILAEDGEADPRFMAQEGMKRHMGAFLGVPIFAGTGCLGTISAVHPQVGYFGPEHLELLELLASICAPYVEIARLSRLSRVDPLTGVLNRRGLGAILAADGDAVEVDSPERLSVALADIDHFKTVNDRFGHAVGDEVLKRVAEALAAVVRSGDAVVRYGGEEFVLVLPGVGLNTATRIAERARRSIERSLLRVGELELKLTISIGVAERRPDEGRDALVGRADDAMYTAKRLGRNRVAAAEEDN